MLIVLYLVSHFDFLFVPCGGLSWLPVNFLLHDKYTVSYRISAIAEFLVESAAKCLQSVSADRDDRSQQTYTYVGLGLILDNN